MRKIDMSQVAQDIATGKYGIDQVTMDIEEGKYEWENVFKLPLDIQMELSKEMAHKKYERVMAKLEYEPRDWSKLIPREDRYACGIRGEEYYRIEYLTLSHKEGVVALGTSRDGTVETFKTKEKLDDFIDALIQARDDAFPA